MLVVIIYISAHSIDYTKFNICRVTQEYFLQLYCRFKHIASAQLMILADCPSSCCCSLLHVKTALSHRPQRQMWSLQSTLHKLVSDFIDAN